MWYHYGNGRFVGMGLTMDNDKEPVPDKVSTNNNDSEVVYNAWSGQQNICPHWSTVGHKKKAKLNIFCDMFI